MRSLLSKDMNPNASQHSGVFLSGPSLLLGTCPGAMKAQRGSVLCTQATGGVVGVLCDFWQHFMPLFKTAPCGFGISRLRGPGLLSNCLALIQKEQDVCSDKEASSRRDILRSWEEYPATTHTYTILLSRKSQVSSTGLVLMSQSSLFAAVVQRTAFKSKWKSWPGA